jgi:hypothetical protein
MKRTALALAAIGAAAVAAVPLTSAGAQTPGPRTITLLETEQGSQFGFVDNPPRARNQRNPLLTPGDSIAFSIPLTDTAGAALGKLHVQCVVTSRGRPNRAEQLCTGVFKLRDGQISVVTAITGEPDLVTGIVTGGDGAYVGARGTFSTDTTSTGATDTISLLG